MIPGPIKLLLWLLPVVVIGVPLAALGVFLLAVVGSPGTCVDDARPITYSLQAGADFQTKWDNLNAQLDAGQPASETFSEHEVTSRARIWADQNDVPVSDLYVCFNADGGSASAKVDVPFFPGDIDVRVRGTMLLTGEHPEAKIDDVEVGGLPEQVSSRVEDFVRNLVEDQTKKITLTHDYTITFSDGTMNVSGTP